MLVSTLLACAISQGAPEVKFPDPALFDELIRKTNDLRAFRAEYHLRSAGKETPGFIRIVYQAPDRAKIEIAGRMVYRIQAGYVDMRSMELAGKPMVAHFAWGGPLRERFDNLATSMRAEFPATEGAWRVEADGGVRFDLSIRAAEGSREKSIDFNVSCEHPREAMFGWLQDLRKREGGHIEENGRVVYEDRDGTKLTLSTRTGFVESVARRSEEGIHSFEIATLDLDPQLGDADFELPEAATSSTDMSSEFAVQAQQLLTSSLRDRVFASIAKQVSEGKLDWDDAAESRLARVFGILHGDSLRWENEFWIQKTRRDIEQFASWLRDRTAGLVKEDREARAALEAAIVEWRRNLAGALEEGLQQRRADLSAHAPSLDDPVLGKSFAEVESISTRAAFDGVVRDPLLRFFDEQIERARSGS